MENKQKYSELFAELRNILIEKKLIGADWKYGVAMITLTGGLYLLGVFLMPIFGPVITILYFSLLFVEMGYISHDIIHNQYFQSVNANRAIAMFYANMGIGLSSSWWIDKHNVGHHNSTNSNIHDTDIRDYDEIFTGRVGKHPIFHRYKKVLFWMAPVFVYFNLLIESYKFLFRKKYFGEMIMNLLFLFFPILLIYQFGIIGGAIVFLSIGAIVGIILGYVFMVNHIGLEVIDGLHIRDYAWLDLQTRTSRNISGTRLTTEIFWGLDKQIEHHLFPQISRRKIRKVAEVVKDFCKKNNLPYHEVSFRNWLKEIYQTLSTGEVLNLVKGRELS